MRRMKIKHPAGYALLTHPTKPASRFSSPVRRRVAQAGWGFRRGALHSHSTKLANDASQVAGYVLARSASSAAA